ncbi:MAG: histidyl-tRNA synthetase [Chloroflexota bacterium]|jgi:histidyl-tRNA synthetase|nr:histidyl-tRNA synthetase [Chloroflexota bacterium]
MRDLLPEETATWSRVERLAEDLSARRGYRRVVTPILEHTEVFAHGVGAGTDIVDKEMYTFEDRGGRSLTLRPEATASVVRAYFEGGLHQGPQPARLHYLGPMFRYDRPQKGRYRTFQQFGVEAIGDAAPELDVEVIELADAWLRACGIDDATLQLNSIGDAVCRPGFRRALQDYYRPHLPNLCEDCRRRFDTNPLRLLDCKKPADEPLQAGAPSPVDHLCDDCRAHHGRVRDELTGLGIEFEENPRLVRGLDYYTRTAFEFWDPGIDGAQNALGGGGRYDGLAEVLGFQATPAVGFAMGLDRVVLAVQERGAGSPPDRPDVVVIAAADAAVSLGLEVARDLRRVGIATVSAVPGRSLKAQMRQATKLDAPAVVIIGEEELDRGEATVRDMADGAQARVPLGTQSAGLVDALRTILAATDASGETAAVGPVPGAEQ